jgi:hypothetical protein
MMNVTETSHFDSAIVEMQRAALQGSKAAPASMRLIQPEIPGEITPELRGVNLEEPAALSRFGEFVQGIDDKVILYLQSLQQPDGPQITPELVKAVAGAARRRGNDQWIIDLAAELKKGVFVAFTGMPDAPQTINGVSVIGTAPLKDGTAGFLLEDGSVVSGSEVMNSFNAASAIQAASILASDSSDEDKVMALTQLGISAGSANQILSTQTAGGLGAALSLFQTATHWDDMSDEQRIGAATQSVGLVVQSLDDIGIASFGSSAASGLLGASSGVAGIVMGVDQAADVIDAIDDMPKHDAQRAGALGLGASGAAIGAGVATVGVATGAIVGAQVGSVVPIVGTVIGAAVGALAGFALGSFGSGKGEAQMMRDSWREGLEKGGFSEKVDGMHTVELADGRRYDIGLDGGHKLVNVDGTERHTFDVDWSNPLSRDAVPQAHLYGIATGLDPSQSKANLWTTAVGQGLNAAMSNATTSEQITDNFRHMMSQGQVNPMHLAFRTEMLRVSNKISDGEYLTYIDQINKMFGTQLQPTDREKASAAIVQDLEAISEPGDIEKELLVTLTDPEKIAEAQNKLAERVGVGQLE